MNNKEKRPIGKILMILAVVFFYVPILYMIIFSFNDGKIPDKLYGIFTALV